MKYFSCIVATIVTGCASATVIPLAQDTIQITSAAAPICGMTGAQNVASQRAAIETIRRGYDRYIIVGGQYQNNIGVVGYTPVTATTTGTATAYGNGNYATAQGHSTTTFSGGQPIVSGSHNQGLVVKMFRADDQSAAPNALDARSELGPEWQKKVASNSLTCVP